MKMQNAADLIEQFISAENWKAARRLIEQELVAQRRDHWLLARLALTYYEAKDYATALRYAKGAHELAPHCPLGLWELAGALDMTGKSKLALKYYGQIIAADKNTSATDPCWESPRWLLSLQVDATYRAALCLNDLGHPKNALYFLRLYLKGLELNLDTIFGAEEALQRIREILEQTGGQDDFRPRKEKLKSLLAV